MCPDLRHLEKVHGILRHITISVGQLVRKVLRVLSAGDAGDLPVCLQPESFIRYICFRHGCLNRDVDRDVRPLVCNDFSLESSYCPVYLLAVQLVSYALYVPALSFAEHVARASQLEVSHRQLESRTELRELADSCEPFACDLRQDFARLIHEVSVSQPVRPAYSSSQLVQLCQSESVGVEDYHRIGIRDVDPVLDDRCRNENVGPSFDKIKHRVLECLLAHPPVAYSRDRIRHEALDRLPYLVEPCDPVVYNVDLSAAREFALDRIAQYLLFVRSHICVDREPVPRRLIDDADILDACKGHVESPRYRGRRQCQHVDALLELLEFLLVPHAESLLLIDDQKPEIFELHIVRQQSVRAYDKVDLTALYCFGRLLLRLCAPEPRQLLYLEREVCKTLFQIVIVLIDEKCRRCEQSRLLSF